MKNILTILFCLFTLSCSSQDETKYKKIKFNWSDDKAYEQVKDTSSDDLFYTGDDTQSKDKEKMDCQCPQKQTRNIYRNGNVSNMPTNIMNWFR